MSYRKFVQEAEGFTENLTGKDIVLLSGPMGAGKSEFVKICVRKILGNETCSPTFAIHQVYTKDDQEIDHIDLYRIESESDLESTGFWEIFEKDHGLIFIEWADRLEKGWLPRTWKSWDVNISVSGEDSRDVRITRL